MQAKFSIHEDQAALLSSYKELESHKLRQSADLYAEIYSEDAELKALTDAAVQGWPGG
jgi:hypothetical protein